MIIMVIVGKLWTGLIGEKAEMLLLVLVEEDMKIKEETEHQREMIQSLTGIKYTWKGGKGG